MKTKKLDFNQTSIIHMRYVLSNSIFLDDVYDPAIIGFDSVTGAVIYDDEKLVRLESVMFNPDEHLDLHTWGEQFEFCINQIQSMFHQECQDGKIPPILLTVFPEVDLSQYLCDHIPNEYIYNDLFKWNDSKRIA